MGYGIHRFRETIDDNLMCGVCGGVLEDAVLTPCGHSFCHQCLHTWLDNPNASLSCPECRTRVHNRDARPILSVRNLILGLEVSCEHSCRGCTTVLKLESMPNHIGVCGFVPLECTGCSETVNRERLAEHQERCEAMIALNASAVRSESPTALRSCPADDWPYLNHHRHAESPCCTHYHRRNGCTENPFCKHYFSEPYVSELTFRVTGLEIKLQKLKMDLEISESKSKKLERELRRTREELQEKNYELREQQQQEFDPDYEYGYTPRSISKLSRLLALYLNNKPEYIETNMVYNSIKRCYDNYAKPSSYHDEIASRVTREVSAMATLECVRDVHMLLATAYSSDWFSDAQRHNLSHWLNVICKTEC